MTYLTSADLQAQLKTRAQKSRVSLQQFGNQCRCAGGAHPALDACVPTYSEVAEIAARRSPGVPTKLQTRTDPDLAQASGGGPSPPLALDRFAPLERFSFLRSKEPPQAAFLR